MALLLISCGEENFTSFSQEDFDEEGNVNNVIVNDLNWVEDSDPRVALLLISKSSLFMGRCTGFMIGEKWLMTNNHCVKNEKEANGLKAIFGYHANRSFSPSLSQSSSILCDKILATNRELDFSILECQGKPGKLFGWVSLEEKPPAMGDELYVVHQNCDYFSIENCFPTKKKSTGKVLDSSLFGEELETSNNFFHDADILQGSSGAPIFDRDSKKVMGLLNVEYRVSEDKNDGRGPMNGAIKMSSILNYLKEKNPSLYKEMHFKKNPPVSYTGEDLIIKGSFRYPDFGDHYIFTLTVEMAGLKDINKVSKIQYSFFQEGRLRIIEAKNSKSFFKKTFSLSNPIFEGFVDVYLKNGNKIKKDFLFQAKSKFPDPYDEGFEIDKVSLEYEVVYDKLKDRFIYSIGMSGEKKSLGEIKSVSYSLLSTPNVKIDKFDKPFRTRLVTSKRTHNLILLIKLKNGSIEKKEVQCFVPTSILKLRRDYKKNQNQASIQIGLKIKKDKKLFYFFGRTVFKFVVYLNGSKRDIADIKRVDYFFKDSWDGKERKVTSLNKGFKFKTPVFRTVNRSLKIYKTRITFNDGRVVHLKGVRLNDFKDFPH